MARRKTAVHVQLNSKGGWDVVREGNKRPTTSRDTQREALVVARDLAQQDQTVVHLHSQEGTVRRSYSYVPRT